MSGSNGQHLTIAFDTWPLIARHRNTGIHVYAKNLLLRFREIASPESVEIRPLISAAVSSVANDFEENEGFRPHQTSLLRIGRIWRYGGACLSALASKADLLFCPSPTTVPVAGLVPVVATIHDIIPVLFPTVPKARGLRFEFANSARFARAVITDSFYSKQDLVERFNLPPSKVHVIYLACDQSVFNDAPAHPMLQAELQKSLGITRSYILHHGRVEERKNLKRLVEAYQLALTRNPNLEFDLVLVGELGWKHGEIVAAAQTVQAPGRVIFAGPLPDKDLAMLLKGATLVVIPSLYEGFCLPLLEAMACGAPTICSQSSCIPEISGEALCYFDPYSIEEMATSIEQALDNANLRGELARKGKQRALSFNWNRCAEETLGILKEAAA